MNKKQWIKINAQLLTLNHSQKTIGQIKKQQIGKQQRQKNVIMPNLGNQKVGYGKQFIDFA